MGVLNEFILNRVTSIQLDQELHSSPITFFFARGGYSSYLLKLLAALCMTDHRHETPLNYAVAERCSTPALTIPPPGKLLDVQAQARTFSMLPVS